MTSINEKFKIGTTQPFSVKCNDGNVYVLKGINDDCNGRTLFNELVSYRLALLLELPIPDFEIINLELEQINSNTEMQLLNFISGPCFATKYLKGTTRLNPPTFEKISNSEDIPGLIIFDQIILNNDRTVNDGNLYFSQKDKKIVMIDHSHVFDLGQIWDINTIKNCMKIPPRIIRNLDGKNYKYLIPFVSGNNPFFRIQTKLNQISIDDISGLFINIPIEWGISDEESSAIKDLLWHQIKHIDQILPQLKTVFTKWKGAC